jgi:hypothetical protein
VKLFYLKLPFKNLIFHIFLPTTKTHYLLKTSNSIFLPWCKLQYKLWCFSAKLSIEESSSTRFKKLRALGFCAYNDMQTSHVSIIISIWLFFRKFSTMIPRAQSLVNDFGTTLFSIPLHVKFKKQFSSLLCILSR